MGKIKDTFIKLLNDNSINFTHGPFFKIVSTNLSKLKLTSFNLLVFYTPRDIDSLYANFPDFQQNNIKLAVFGESTLKKAQEKGLKIDVTAPSQEFPSMSMALDHYLATA